MKEVISSRRAEGAPGKTGEKTTVRVKDLETAWFLIHMEQLQHLGLFIEKEVTVSQVSEELGLDFNRAYAFVKRLLRLKLIKVSRLEKRKGRPIRHYRSVADQFFVPLSLISLEHVLRVMSAELQHIMLRNIAQSELHGLDQKAGLQAMKSETGEMNFSLMKGPNEPMSEWSELQSASLLTWQILNLDYAAAKNLQKEMEVLIIKYLHQTGPQKYLMHVGLCALTGADQVQKPDQLLPFNAFKGL